MSDALNRLRTRQAIQKVEGLLGYDISVLGKDEYELLGNSRSEPAFVVGDQGICPRCSGEGYLDQDGIKILRCGQCGGSGYIET